MRIKKNTLLIGLGFAFAMSSSAQNLTIDGKFGRSNSTNNGQNSGFYVWNINDSAHVIYSANSSGISPTGGSPVAGYWNSNHRMRFRTFYNNQGFLFENNQEKLLADLDSLNGNFWINGAFRSASTGVSSFVGSVGIGTEGPTGKLDVRPANGSARFVFTSSGNDYPRFQMGGDSTSIAGVFNRLHASANLYFGEAPDTGGYIFRGSGDFLLANPNNVGIGTTSPDYKLDVKGTIRAEEVIVATGWSDFVFESDFKLRSLADVENHIAEHGHLPDVPSAAVVESKGLSVGEAQKIMMQKIEELTLYMIEKEKQMTAMRGEIADLKAKLGE